MSVETARQAIASHLVEMEETLSALNLDPSRITVLIRDERGPEHSVMLTSDEDVDEAIAVVRALSREGIVTDPLQPNEGE